MIAREQTREEFLTHLAHELRNPLATILSSVELVHALGPQAVETPELLYVVDQKVRAMGAVLDRLLDPANDAPKHYVAKSEILSPIKIPTVTPQTPVAGALKVLVVDDNETAADSLSQLLMLRGYEVAVAYNGAQGFEKALEFRPHVAILDIGMPDMNGYQLAQKLCEAKLSCTYVALTGYRQEHDKTQAQLAGFSYHLTKPTGIDKIESILQKVALVAQNKEV